MAVYKCKMCGGNLEVVENQKVVECEYCGTMQTVPSADDEKKVNLFNRANRLRMNSEFDKAAAIYETIVAEFPKEAEGYWGLCLCNYGIEYVDDPVTGRKIPTCHRSSFESILEDSNFELALHYTDSATQQVYLAEANKIEELRKSIIEVSAKEEPYDIFICYKETSENGDRTIDSVIAQDVYQELTSRGYRVFFSRITLENKLGVAYEPYIFSALHSAKIMLVFGTSYDNFDAVWVKNEWSRFLQLIAKGEKKTLIPCYKDVDAYDMPKEFAKLQGQDMGKIGAIQDLLRGIEKIIGQEAVVVTESERDRRAKGPALIHNVSAIGSCDFENCWPAGKYSTVFNYDGYNVIYFHLSINNYALRHKTTIKSGMTIYNEKNYPVFEDVTDFHWESDYGRLARSWVIKGGDGTFVPAGNYRVEFWIEDSQVFEFQFTVTSNEEIRKAREKEEELRAKRRANNQCQYCGNNNFKGLFVKKCAYCGRPKDY